MKSKKSFRDFKSYKYGAGEIKLEYWSPEIIKVKYKEGKTTSGYHWDTDQIDLPEGLSDRPTLLCLVHEMIHQTLEDSELSDGFESAMIEEAIIDTIAGGLCQIAHRNPEFWRSLSLEE